MLMLMGTELQLINKALRESNLAVEAGHQAAQRAAAPTEPLRMPRRRIRIPMQEVIRRQGKDLGVLRVLLEQGITAVSAATLTTLISYSYRTKVNLGARRATTSPYKASMTSTP